MILLVIGPSTEIVAGNGLVLTVGAVDSHVHFICPQLLEEATGFGITTFIGGTGPADGTKATTVTPGTWNLAMSWAPGCSPPNVVFLGKGNTVSHEALREQLRGGAAGSSCTKTGERPPQPSTRA